MADADVVDPDAEAVVAQLADHGRGAGQILELVELARLLIVNKARRREMTGETDAAMPASTSADSVNFGRAAFIRPEGSSEDYPNPTLEGAKV